MKNSKPIRKMNMSVYCLGLVLISFVVTSCGPRTFTKGRYEDPEEVVLLDDRFNENDMQLIANKMVKGLETEFVNNKRPGEPPIVMFGRVTNRTSEHVDLKLLTDKIRTTLIKSGKFRFVDKASRDELIEELRYQEGEFVDQSTAMKVGKQLGVQYIINGDLGSRVQQVGRDKYIYYKMNFNLIDVETAIIVWAGEREIRKYYQKRSFRD